MKTRPILLLVVLGLIPCAGTADVLTPAADGGVRDGISAPRDGVPDVILENAVVQALEVPGFEERGIMEFSLQGLSLPIDRAKLRLPVFASMGPYPFRINVYAYSADGRLTLSDWRGPAFARGFLYRNDATDRRVVWVNVTSAVRAAVTAGQEFIGFRFEFGVPSSIPMNGPFVAFNSLEVHPGLGLATLRVNEGVDDNPVTRLVSTSGVDTGDCTVNPCRKIQFAIDKARHGDTIRIAPGTYTETLAILSRGDLTIEGESAATTIIQGDRVFTQVLIRSSIGITIRNLTVRDGGPFIEGGGQPEGGGISIAGPRPSSTSVILENLILTGNQASLGGAIGIHNGDLTIINCLISDNVANSAAGAMIVRSDSTVVLETTTVVNNRANFLVGGIENEANLTVRNSIVWNNNLQQIRTNPGSPSVVTSVSFSDIQGGHAGLANINQDPQFADASFRLSIGSPGIDAGNNTGAPATDLDRKSRPTDGDGDGIAVVDMGAFERRRLP